MIVNNNKKELLKSQMQDLLRASNNVSQGFTNINKIDRDSRNLSVYTDLIRSGQSAESLIDYLNNDITSFHDYIYFLDMAYANRRIDIYDDLLKIAFERFGSNSYLAYSQARFGNYKYLDDDEIINILLDSSMFKHIEFGLVLKARLLSTSIDSNDIQDYFKLTKSVNLPKSFKSPYIEIFSRVVKTMGRKRPKSYELGVNRLINLFESYLSKFQHPWYLRLYIRMYMSILKIYDNKLYAQAYEAYQNDLYDNPTSKFNVLHFFNYYRLNELAVNDSFLDDETRKSLQNHPSTIMLQDTIRDINSRPVKTKKVGVIVSGQIRGIQEEQLSFKNSNGYEFDVFIACWEKKGFKIPHNVVPNPYYRIFDRDIVDIFNNQGILGDQLYQRYPSIEKILLEGSFVNEELIKEHAWITSDTDYSIKNVTTYSEDEDVLKHIFDKYDLKQMPNNAMNNQLKMFFMNYCGYQALYEEETKQHESYDFIIKVRPDMIVDIDIDKVIKELENTQAISADVLRSYDCGDRIAIGNRVIMGQYLKMFENLSLYQNNPKTMFGCGKFKVHAPIDYQIVSSGGQIYRSKYVQHGDYLELDIVDRDILISGMLEDAKARGLDNIDIRIFESLGVRT